MADRQLRAEVIIDAKKGIETLKTVERVGNQTVKTVTRNGEMISKTITTVSGQSATATKLNFIAAAQGASLLLQTVGPVTRALGDMRKAAIDDEDAITRRNAALKGLSDITPEYIAELDAQVDSYQRLFGISDEVTHEIQTQIGAFGENKEQIKLLTDATIQLATITGDDYITSAEKVRKFMDGEFGDSIRGTTILVDKNATQQDRLNALLDGTQAGLTILEDRMETGKGAQDKWTEAMGEFKEGIGAFFNTEFAVDQLDALTDSLFGLSDWIKSNQTGLENFAKVMQRIGQAIGTGGLSEGYRALTGNYGLNSSGPAYPDIGPGLAKSLDPWGFPSLSGGYLSLLASQRAQGAIGRAMGQGLSQWGDLDPIERPGTAGIGLGGTITDGVQLTARQRMRGDLNKAFGQQGLANIVGGGGGIGGMAQTALTMGLSAVNPLLGLVGGGLLGKLFGGGGKKNQDRGMTQAMPIYVEVTNMPDSLSQQGNVSRVAMLGGGAGYFDRQLQGLRMQGMRVGA